MSDPFISEIMDAADAEISAMRRQITKLSGALSLATSERDDLSILISSLKREKVIAKEINDALIEKNHKLQQELNSLASLNKPPKHINNEFSWYQPMIISATAIPPGDE